MPLINVIPQLLARLVATIAPDVIAYESDVRMGFADVHRKVGILFE